jgi:hypothetical protein
MIPQFYFNFYMSSALSFMGIFEDVTLAILVGRKIE